jgi:predicted nuclease of predicted toxin-antitoxin system
MITILVDYHLEGQAALISGTYNSEGWAELFPLRFLRFKDVDLSHDSNDREVWQFAQANQMILLTGNRNMKGEASLEQTLREENTPTSLPVLTIGNVERVAERRYRERCVTRLAEIISELENYLGASRLFIP